MQKTDERLQNVIELLKEMQEDSCVPRNVRGKVEATLAALQSECDSCLRITKALDELDEVSDDSNVEPYTRSQILNVVSVLESL